MVEANLKIVKGSEVFSIAASSKQLLLAPGMRHSCKVIQHAHSRHRHQQTHGVAHNSRQTLYDATHFLTKIGNVGLLKIGHESYENKQRTEP